VPWDRNRQSHHITSVVRTTHTDGDVSSGEAAVPSTISRAHSIMRTMQGYEAIHRLHKRQLEGVTKGDVLGQHRVITQMWAGPHNESLPPSSHTPMSFCNTTGFCLNAPAGPR
jgi:hypothetical protein